MAVSAAMAGDERLVDHAVRARLRLAEEGGMAAVVCAVITVYRSRLSASGKELLVQVAWSWAPAARQRQCGVAVRDREAPPPRATGKKEGSGTSPWWRTPSACPCWRPEPRDGDDAEAWVTVDGRKVPQLRWMRWNSRGRHTIFLDGGAPVDMTRDLHGWLHHAGAARNSVLLLLLLLRRVHIP
ncbi:hypothetical protein C2845_PM03G34590 [Panicum miliaceum]|uniref:Uncharacterized protein n=1 Tax=Panicum miliaceum TaxID=4540 RepID=A0A3L6TCS1_PANMI|nr:hypothetical protein C2845_PM03G34590 [Panicum miliaceum]